MRGPEYARAGICAGRNICGPEYARAGKCAGRVAPQTPCAGRNPTPAVCAQAWGARAGSGPRGRPGGPDPAPATRASDACAAAAGVPSRSGPRCGECARGARARMRGAAPAVLGAYRCWCESGAGTVPAQGARRSRRTATPPAVLAPSCDAVLLAAVRRCRCCTAPLASGRARASGFKASSCCFPAALAFGNDTATLPLYPGLSLPG
jgi:hypothetical protein